MYSQVEFRSVIRFLLLKKYSTTNVITELKAVYGDHCPTESTIYRWVALFKGGRESVFDEKSSGRPLEIPENKTEKLAQIIRENRKATTRTMCDLLNVGKGSLQPMMASLGVRKLCSRFVPKFLTFEMCERRLSCCLSNLAILFALGDSFLANIVTMDETPLSLYLPESKRDSMEWKFQNEPPTRKLRASATHRKATMLTVYWDRKGIVASDCNSSTSINSLYYMEQLRNARSKKRKPTNEDLWLLQDNAPIHTSDLSVDEIRKCGFKVLQHPPYSPDLAPSDFYLFTHLKKHLSGNHFSDREEVEAEVDRFFKQQPANFYKKAFDELAVRWQKCVDANGGYIEK